MGQRAALGGVTLALGALSALVALRWGANAPTPPVSIAHAAAEEADRALGEPAVSASAPERVPVLSPEAESDGSRAAARVPVVPVAPAAPRDTYRFEVVDDDGEPLPGAVAVVGREGRETRSPRTRTGTCS